MYKGIVSQETIDLAVHRVLKLKFELGLFESPYPEFQSELFNNSQYEDFISEATAQSITLIKNEGILPLTDASLKIGIIGQPADSLRHMYGAYTGAVTFEMLMELAADKDAVGMAGVKLESVDENAQKVNLEKINEVIKAQYPMAKTIKSALKTQFPNIEYATGFPVGTGETINAKDWKQAEILAIESDIIIVCVGGKNGVGQKCTSGEGIDAVKIELPGEQEEAVKKLYQLNPNMIVVHFRLNGNTLDALMELTSLNLDRLHYKPKELN